MNLQNRYNKILEDFPDAPDRFELTVKEVYTEILTAGSCAMDLGAHTGKHTLPMGRIVGPTGRVDAFEPILEKYIHLTGNLNNSGLAHVNPFNVCCGDENTTVQFTYLPNDPGKSAIHLRSGLDREEIEKVTQECLAIRLDDFFPQHIIPEFIKIDIEGAELMALQGARELIARAQPILHIEIGEPSLVAFGVDPKGIFYFLHDLGFELFDILGNELQDIERYTESVEARGVYDYIAIPIRDQRKGRVLDACERMWWK